ncbi:MAG: hypothetical protein D4R82_03140 [Dehalococcoidia bacterium]|nr:MAG: hypothetical protein D4R82_03140 [Dehalococcoidia bacterium]
MLYSKDHLERANELVEFARIYAIETYILMLEKYSELEALGNSNLLEFWDYLITIAGVGVAFMEIADTVPEEDQPGISYAIQKKLNDWQSGSYDVMADFLSYYVNLTDSGVEIPGAIGGWIWVNLEKHGQSNQKLRELASSLELARAVGLPILITFHDWWKQE